MITSKNPIVHAIGRTLLNITFALSLGISLLVLYWGVSNTFFASVTLVDPRLVGESTVHVGDVLSLEYVIYRYRSCTLEIQRLFDRNIDHREFQAQYVTQFIEADRPLYARPAGYHVRVPEELTTGDYTLVSKVRYYCNPLDWVFPRIVVTHRIPLHVIGCDTSETCKPSPRST